MIADEASIIASLCMLSSRLIDFDHDTQSYVPGLAESWTRDADGRTIDLYLRDGLKFSDGEPLTVEDAIFTLKAVYDERTASPVLRDAMTFGGKQIELTALDSRRLRFVFPEPLASPESHIYNLPIVPRHKMEASLTQGTLGQSWAVGTDPGSMASCGPFMLAESTPGERVVVTRNPHYWKKDKNGAALPYLDSITLEVVSDLNNALARLGQGTLDLVDRIRPADYAGLKDSTAGPSSFDLGPGLAIDHLWFNLNTGTRGGKPVIDPVKRGWFSDARFRRAVSHAIDRESIASFTLLGLATPLYGMISPANRTWAALDLPRADYNLERARTLLSEAGFTQKDESGGPRLFDSSGNRVEWTLLVPVEMNRAS
jgi:peptide/nickel transport system substrate-binding protein